MAGIKKWIFLFDEMSQFVQSMQSRGRGSVDRKVMNGRRALKRTQNEIYLHPSQQEINFVDII